MRARTGDLQHALSTGRVPDPEPPEHPNGGCRRRVPDRVCFDVDLLAVPDRCRLGNEIEAQLHYQVSDTTLRARRTEWVQAGVFHQLMEDCSATYHQLIGIEIGDVAIDGSTQLPPRGRPRHPVTASGSKGRKTMKWSIGVDANGIGLGGIIVTGSTNDYPLLQPTLDEVCGRDRTAAIDRLHPRPRLRLPATAR